MKTFTTKQLKADKGEIAQIARQEAIEVVSENGKAAAKLWFAGEYDGKPFFYIDGQGPWGPITGSFASWTLETAAEEIENFS